MGYTYMMGAEFLLVKLFCLLFFLGIILFLAWAIRTLNKKQLKKLVVGFLVIGLLGMVGSSLFMMKTGKLDGDWKDGKLKYCEELMEKEVENP